MKVKYYYTNPLQLRSINVLTDANGNIVFAYDEDPTYIRDIPRATVCTILKDNTLSVGYAICSKKDHFNKKTGRNIAFARALNKPYAVVDVTDKNIHEATEEVLATINII